MSVRLLTLTGQEIALLRSALDSHRYWQLSDAHYRHSGFVIHPGSDDPEVVPEMQACEGLDEKLLACRVFART